MSRKKVRILDPVYAFVGATEATALALRDLGARSRGGDATPTASTEDVAEADAPVLAKLRGDAVDIARGAVSVPFVAVGQTLTRYTDLADRGQKALSGVVPFSRKAAQEGEQVAKAEEARARREARRLARQAGETAGRGRAYATRKAEETGRLAERTLESVRHEAEQVVEAVSHPGRAGRPVRSTVGRRAAVSDVGVRSTAPTGGDADKVDSSDKAEKATASGVEAGASSAARRSPRTRRATGAANSGAAKTRSATTGTGTATTPSVASGDPAVPASTTTAKKAAAKKAAGTTPAKKTTAKKSTAPRKTTKKTTPAVGAAGTVAGTTGEATGVDVDKAAPTNPGVTEPGTPVPPITTEEILGTDD